MTDDTSNLIGGLVGGVITLAVVDRILPPRRRYYYARRKSRRRK